MRVTIEDAPAVLNLNDRAMWVLGYNAALAADAALLGWLNPDTGKTCSVDEKHSMEKHQGLPGATIAKGYSVPLVAA